MLAFNGTDFLAFLFLANCYTVNIVPRGKVSSFTLEKTNLGILFVPQ